MKVCVVPTGAVAVCGLTAIDTRAAGVTVRTEEPETEPTVAVMVAVPCPVLVARPAAFTVAAEGVSELQVALAVRS